MAVGELGQEPAGIKRLSLIAHLTSGYGVGQAHTAEPQLKGKKEKEDLTINTGKTGKGVFSDFKFQE